MEASRIRKNFFNSRKERLFFLCLGAAGLVNSCFFFSWLDHFPYNYGKGCAGLFLPVLFSVVYASVTGYQQGYNRNLLLKTFSLFLVQMTPFLLLSFQVFKPRFGDDFHRYHDYARHMIRHHTLWGADKLAYPHLGNSYLTQPGYRYIIAAELVLFGKLFRFTQFLHLLFLIGSLFCFQQMVSRKADRRTTGFIFLLLILLTPYATKNLLMGISEWLTAVLLMMAAYFYSARRNTSLCMVLLGLVPFFRQNLLIAVLVLALALLGHSRKKLLHLACFLLPLLLPLYHNLYYAGEWRFLVTLHINPFLTREGYDFSILFYHLSRLIGLDPADHFRLDFWAILFLPFSLFVYGYLLRKLPNPGWKFLFLLITLSALLPSLYLGRDYYPRFEFLSVIMFLVTYVFLNYLIDETKNKSVPPDDRLRKLDPSL